MPVPVIPSLILTNHNPVYDYTASVVCSGSTSQAVIADSLGNQIVFIQTTSSNAISSSYAYTSSYDFVSVLSITSSFATQSISASYLSGSATASLYGTSSWANNTITSSYSLSGSYVLSASSALTSITSSWITSSNVYGTLTGSFSGSSVTGSHYGTSSWAVNATSASYSLSGSYSFSGSYTLSASNALASITSSYITSSNVYGTLTGSFSGSYVGSVTGSLYGTSSMAVTSSWGVGIPMFQVGQFSASNVTSFSVSFNFPFPNTNYAVFLQGSGSTALSGSRISSALLPQGFTASFNAYTGYIHWQAISWT
jgi:hypothetical protein